MLVGGHWRNPRQIRRRAGLKCAATEAAEAVKTVVRKLKPRDKARQWLMDALAGGPMLAETVKEMAKAAGISARTLRRAFERGNFGHRKNADGRCV
jgi:AraC-like DNA-binding protein